MYATQLREGLAAAIDTGRLAEAWQVLHPAAVKRIATRTTKADPALAAFLQAARDAIVRVLQGILPKAWTEGWALGQQAALSLATVQPVDWGTWAPGDHEAAAIIAGPGLRQLLAAQGITIQSIADSRLEELAKILEDTLRGVPLPDGTMPTPLSVAALAKRLTRVLDDPSRAEAVARTEIARAQVAASEATYREHGIAEFDVLASPASCQACRDAAAENPHLIGSLPLPIHPGCRCAEAPVVAGAI